MHANVSPDVSPDLDNATNPDRIREAVATLAPQIGGFVLCILRKQDAQREASIERIKMTTAIKLVAVGFGVNAVMLFEAVCEEISRVAKARGRKIAIKMNKTDEAILSV